MSDTKIIVCKNYEYLAHHITAAENSQPVETVEEFYKMTKPLNMLYHDNVVRTEFADGEIYHKYNTDIKGKNVIIIGGTRNDMEFMELYDLAWYACKAGAADIRLYIPYFGYSTMERAVKPGEIVKAKVRAQILSNLPCTQRITIVMTDLHASGMEHYFEGSIHTVHHYAKHAVISRCQLLKAEVIASTDAGRAKWVESLANEMNIQSAFITKRRLSGSTTEVAAVNADVKDKVVVVYDDMCRTGSSLIKAGQVYREIGAKEVHAVFTHPVLPGKSLENLVAANAFDSISFGNTLPINIPTHLQKQVVSLNVVDTQLLSYLFDDIFKNV